MQPRARLPGFSGGTQRPGLMRDKDHQEQDDDGVSGKQAEHDAVCRQDRRQAGENQKGQQRQAKRQSDGIGTKTHQQRAPRVKGRHIGICGKVAHAARRVEADADSL